MKEAYVNHAWICSWNQPVLSNKVKVSCSRKQWKPLWGFELKTGRLKSDTLPTAPLEKSTLLKQPWVLLNNVICFDVFFAHLENLFYRNLWQRVIISLKRFKLKSMGILNNCDSSNTVNFPPYMVKRRTFVDRQLKFDGKRSDYIR